MALTPVQPPVAVQLVALLELHDKRLDPPDAMLVGLAVNVNVGSGAEVTVMVRTSGVGSARPLESLQPFPPIT